MPFDAHTTIDPVEAAMQQAFRQIEAQGAAKVGRNAQDAAAHCPLAQKIIAANQAPELGSGLMGAVGVALSMRCPKTAKRKAAETINRLRVNRMVCKRQGRNHHLADARLLRRARVLRECAIEFAAEIKATAEAEGKTHG